MKCILLMATLLGVAATVQAAASIDSPVAPKETLALFQVPEDVTVELVAAEPEVIDPVALAFDVHLNLYVVENRGYPVGPGEGLPPAGLVALLRDLNKDGYYESRVTFAEGLAFPNGVMPWNKGVLVTCAPDVLYLEDTDGDFVADVREVFLTGFSEGGSTQLQVSHPTYGPDNQIYFTNGLSGGTVVVPDRPGLAPVESQRNDVRYNPRTQIVEPVSGQAQFGQAFDRAGHRYLCTNRVPAAHAVLPLDALSRNPLFAYTKAVHNLYGSDDPVPLHPISDNITTAISHAGTFTAACGLAIYNGSLLPERYRDQAFTCDPTGNLVHCMIRESHGATFNARPEVEGKEFLASTDNWFRPVFLANGPEGALYLCDMYRKSIEHPVYLPEAIRAVTDFDSGKDRGRIYRIVPKSPDGEKAPLPKRPTLAAPIPANPMMALPKPWWMLLGHDNGWWRETAQRELVQSAETSASAYIRKGLEQSKNEDERLRCLWTLDGLNALTVGDIASALADASAVVRENGVRLAPKLFDAEPDLPAVVARLAADADARVRFEVALALGAAPEPDVESLARIAVADLHDEWTRAAVLSSVGNQSDQLLDRLMDSEALASPEFSAWAHPLGTMAAGVLEPAELCTRLSEWIVTASEKNSPAGMALLLGVFEGGRGRPIAFASWSALASTCAAPGGALARGIESLLVSAREVVPNSGAPLSDRVLAVEFLACGDLTGIQELLLDRLSPYESQELQLASAEALAGFPEDSAAAALLAKDRWSSLTPVVRSTLIGAFLSKNLHLPALLSAIENGDVETWAIEPARRTQLMSHRDEGIASRAKALFESVQNPERKKVYEEYRAVLDIPSHREAGKKIFEIHCAQCHRLDGVGQEVGPDLMGVRSQPKETLLLHILIPNHEMVPGFTNYIVETVDGDMLTGLIAAETPTSLTLRQAGGLEENILREDIVEMRSTTLSLMPQELEKNMGKQDLADLIGFLRGE